MAARVTAESQNHSTERILSTGNQLHKRLPPWFCRKSRWQFTSARATWWAAHRRECSDVRSDGWEAVTAVPALRGRPDLVLAIFRLGRSVVAILRPVTFLSLLFVLIHQVIGGVGVDWTDAAAAVE